MSVILAGARTPFGKFGGAFKDIPATTLGAHAIRAALERSGVKGEDVDYVTVANELRRRGLKVGAAALCGGGGQGDALIVRRPRQ